VYQSSLSQVDKRYHAVRQLSQRLVCRSSWQFIFLLVG
jgi:hypothetical protein